ncbi:hypothetical protein LUZ61_008562 [Rhynchospora tenuis]|uniref:Cysteine protease n=1 Tax=Rhynchospora tenuis TaxID=198213 RepID=A0AAD5ZVS4_9POAL|nr:hypothetical protein LUZ61_008562 [Rhynchospora tenuis]
MAISYRFSSNVLLLPILLFIIGALVGIAKTEDSLLPVYEKWISDFGRVYQSDIEKQQRYEVFKANYQFIQSMKNQSHLTYTVDLNEFADITNEEFLAKYAKSQNPSRPKEATPFKYANFTTAPSCVDWRSANAVTPVRSQGNCAIGAIEGLNKIKTGTLLSLSEQELVDCCTTCGGCNGICVDCAFQWISYNGGITTESDYPYSTGAGTCNYPKTYDYAASLLSYQDVTTYCESCLKNAVANQPVSAVIDAGGSAFQFYTSGIFTGPCGTNLNLAVLVVGYGPCTTGTPYWIVKTSWGTNFGESGYIRMQRNIASTAGLCGIAMQPSYPIM